jgi:hypothetical protein
VQSERVKAFPQYLRISLPSLVARTARLRVCAGVRDPALPAIACIYSFNEDKLPEWAGVDSARVPAPRATPAARTDGMARKQAKP